MKKLLIIYILTISQVQSTDENNEDILSQVANLVCNGQNQPISGPTLKRGKQGPKRD